MNMTQFVTVLTPLGTALWVIGAGAVSVGMLLMSPVRPHDQRDKTGEGLVGGGFICLALLMVQLFSRLI